MSCTVITKSYVLVPHELKKEKFKNVILTRFMQQK